MPEIAAYPVPHRLNRTLTACIVAIALFQLFALPLLIAHDKRFGWLILALVPFTNMHWALIHESIHGLFADDRQENHRAGRMLSILLGVAFHVVRFGHLMHHQHNRRWESELYDPAKESWLKRAPGYYATLFGGLYAIEWLLSLALLLPRRWQERILDGQCRNDRRGICANGVHPAAVYFFRRDRLKESRADFLLSLVLLAGSLALYGAHWPFFLLLMLGRAFALSFSDNVYHYETPGDNSQPAHELNLWPPLSLFLLYFNLHRTHHRHAAIPWRHLKKLHQQEGNHYDRGFFAACAAQLRGPVNSDRLA